MEEVDRLGGYEEQAAAAVRRFGHLLAGRHIGSVEAEEIETTLQRLGALIEVAGMRTKQHEHARSPRYTAFVRTGQAVATPDGEAIEFDRSSIVGGMANPFGTEAHHRRDGSEAVTTVTFGPAFEGPPGRVHGGVVAMVLDEATATLMPMLGRFAFTGSVSLRLVAPAPLGVEVTFRSHLRGHDGRKLFVRCIGAGPDGIFVEADATYIEIDPAVALPWLVEARRAYLDAPAG